MDIYDRIRTLRIRMGMSQEELAEKTGYSNRSSIAKIENGGVDLPQSKIKAFALALSTTPQALMGYDSSVDIVLPGITQVKTINVYENISCGNGGFVDDNVVDTITLPIDLFKNKKGEYFGQYAKGDSMIGVGINEGDLLIFEHSNQLASGQIGCFCIDDNFVTCKKYNISSNNELFLLPANDKYSPISINEENHFRIIGRLVTTIKKEV